MNPEYILILSLVLVVWFVACLIFGLSYFLNDQENNFEKLSSYECGFQPFEDTRQNFNIEFYLVGILFVIFDLEIVFLFPYCLCVKIAGFFGALWVYIFLYVLTIDSYMSG